MTLGRARWEAAILLALCAVLAGYLWHSRERATSAERESRKSHVLPTFDPKLVRRIAISERGLGQAALILRRDPKGGDPHHYRLGEAETAGASAPEVDRAEVASLLRTLDFATFLRTLDGDRVPSDAFGDSGPKFTLEVDMDAVSYRVTFGGAAANPPGTRYARTTGDDGTDRVGVVVDSLAAALDKDARELRGRLLFPYAKSQTKSLRIEGPAGRTTLLADPLGFRVTHEAADRERSAAAAAPLGESRRADPARVDGLFFQLARAGMEAYPAATAASEAPLVVVQVPEGGAEVRLEIGGDCHEHPGLVQVVRTAPDSLVGCTDAALLEVLTPRDLTLHAPWPLRADEIDHIVITAREQTLDLIRDGAAFRLLAPNPKPIGLERGNEYLRDLSDLTLGEVPCRGGEVGQVRVVGQPEGSSGGRELRLTLLEDEGRPLLRREDDAACLLLTERAGWLLDPSSSWYESLEILSVRADEVMSLVSSGPDLAREELHRVDGELQLHGAPGDDALIDGLLRTLAPLRALRIAQRRSSAPWKTRLDVRIEARSSGPFNLRIGPRVRGGHLAALAGQKTEFIVTPEVVRTLETSLRSRAPAQWNPDAFAELSVTAHGLTYRFRRWGDELVPTDDFPRELGPALAQALSGLIPISAVRTDRRAQTGTPAELRLEGLYAEGSGAPRRLSVTLGAQVLLGDRSLQLMTIDGAEPGYYVDRTAVLAVLDLL